MSDRERKRILDEAVREVRGFTGLEPGEIAASIKPGSLDRTHDICEKMVDEQVALFKRYMVEYPELHWLTAIGAMDAARLKVMMQVMGPPPPSRDGDEWKQES